MLIVPTTARTARIDDLRAAASTVEAQYGGHNSLINSRSRVRVGLGYIDFIQGSSSCLASVFPHIQLSIYALMTSQLVF